VGNQTHVSLSTYAFRALWNNWDPSRSSQLVSAAEFAECLRSTIKLREGGLESVPRVCDAQAAAASEWLTLYEQACVSWEVQKRDAERRKTAPPAAPQAAPPRTEEDAGEFPLRDELLKELIVQYAIMAGPMGDASQIVEKAKAVLVEL